MRKKVKQGRTRRVHKEWVKGNRERVSRVDAEGDTTWGGQESMRPRAITIDEVADLEGYPRGQVIRTQSGRYDVALARGGEGPGNDAQQVLSCRIKRGASTENEYSTIAVVGDYVRVQPLENERGLIVHVEERKTHLGRNSAGLDREEHVIAANVDVLLCIVSADRPDFRNTIIDRYIVAALLGEVTPVVVMNKMDTVDEEAEEWLRGELAIYETLGYSVQYVSAKTGAGIAELFSDDAACMYVLTGQSGVGKSALTNAALGYEARRTGEVREKDRRGMHTTVGSEMLALPGGGYIIDTPGLREFGIWDLEPEELDGYFVEFLEHLQQCKYLPCTHTHEPGCAVIEAMEEGLIDERRYASYLAIFDTLEQRA